MGGLLGSGLPLSWDLSPEGTEQQLDSPLLSPLLLFWGSVFWMPSFLCNRRLLCDLRSALQILCQLLRRKMLLVLTNWTSPGNADLVRTKCAGGCVLGLSGWWWWSEDTWGCGGCAALHCTHLRDGTKAEKDTVLQCLKAAALVGMGTWEWLVWGWPGEAHPVWCTAA